MDGRKPAAERARRGGRGRVEQKKTKKKTERGTRVGISCVLGDDGQQARERSTDMQEDIDGLRREVRWERGGYIESLGAYTLHHRQH